MIDFRNITKLYKTDFWKPAFKALEDISFSIKEGSLTGFLGSNGSGKTTSIKIILQLTKAHAGEVSYGSLGKTRNEIFSAIGYMPERPYFYPELTGQEYLQYMGRLSGMSATAIRDGMARWVPRVDLSHAMGRPLKTYSKGMLQRLGVMAAVLHSPRLVILDEPVSGLDPIGRRDIKDLLVELHKKEGKTIFFSTHIVPDVEEICDDIIVVEKGKLIYQGNMIELLRRNNGDHYEIKYVEGGKEFSRQVEGQEKDLFIKNIVGGGGSVISLTPSVKHLEQLIYKV